jgi:hypothetical protein
MLPIFVFFDKLLLDVYLRSPQSESLCVECLHYSTHRAILTDRSL